MKKRIDVSSVASSLRGESVFFPTKDSKPAPEQAGEPIEQKRQKEPLPHSPITVAEEVQPDSVIPRYHEPMTPPTHDTMIPSSEDEAIEVVRKAVKQIGKEGATQRLTLVEKQALADIEYSYHRQGIRTSGNEIIRIALNYAVEEYRKNGENSILAKVLKRLNS